MMKLILILLTLVLFSCIAQKQITQLENEKVNPCDDIVDIDDNPNVLKDCFPNHTTFGIGEGTSPRDSIAIMKATMRSQRDLLSNLKDTKIITLDSLGNTSVKTNISGVLENVLILKTFISEENGRYKSIVITTGTLGEKDGKSTTYHENGQIKEEGNNKDGSIDSVEEPEPINIETLNNRDGIFYTKDTNEPYTGAIFRLFESGEKRGEGYLKDGNPDGKSTRYLENGQINLEASWKDGEKDGKWTSYNRDGSIKKVEEYKNGKLVK